MAKLFTENNPVVELNHVASVYTGQIKAQYEMTGQLATDGAQQGMLLAVDDVAKTVAYPADENAYVYLHASEEQIYEEHLGRESFKLNAPKLPRLYKLSVGDIFETNAVDDADLADVTAANIIGIPGIDGLIHLFDNTAASNTSTVVLNVVEEVTLPNGKPGIKFAVAKA
jgi:hypothetical protein